MRSQILNDGDVVQIGQHEIMYMDDRQSRGRPQANEHFEGVETVAQETPDEAPDDRVE